MKKHQVIIYVILFSLSSCIGKYKDFSINSNAQIIAPLAYGSFNLGEILSAFNEDSVFNKDSLTELTFSYRDDKVAIINFNEIVELPSYIKLNSITQKLGLINFDGNSFRDSITVSILKSRLPENLLIQNITENKSGIFPDIQLGNGSSDLLHFQIKNFDLLQPVHFVSGELKVIIRNDFPGNCKALIELTDMGGRFIEYAEFGAGSANGLAPQEMEEIKIDLAGKEITAPLFYRIVAMDVFESVGSVYILPTNGIYLKGEFLGIQVDSGIFKSESFTYQSEPEQIQISIKDSIHITKLLVQSGNLNISLHKTFKPSGTLRLTIPSLHLNGLDFSIDIPLSESNESIVSADISGTELFLSNEKYSSNSIEFYLTYINVIEDQLLAFNSDDTFTSTIEFSDLVFSYVEGDFGNVKMDLSAQGIKIKKELWDLISGEIFGADPVLTLFFSNPVGVPVLFDMHIDAYNRKGETVTLSNTPYILPYPKSIDNAPMKSELEFNSSNSTIFEFMKLPPNDSMNFVASVELNPPGYINNEQDNFVDLNNPFQIGLEFKVPILLSGVFFNYTDTIFIANSNLDQLIESAELIFETNNSIPMQIDLSLTPFDTIQGVVTGEELYVTLLDAAEVDEFGNVLNATHARNSMMLSPEALHSIVLSNSLLLHVSFLSPNDGTSPAMLKNEYGFDVRVVVDANPNL
ncbi:MAG: hypothetical protein ACERKD_02305 [Prolixibacteraceae bacterium]